MIRSIRLSWLPILAWITCVPTAGPWPILAAGESAAWRIGYAEADITPAPGKSQMAGYGRERSSQGVLAPLRMQVLALQDGCGQFGILVAADILEFDRTMVDGIRYSVTEKHGIPGSHILLAASHTHWGPATCFHAAYGIGAPNIWYMSRLEEAILAGIDRALGDLAPATLDYGEFDFRGIGCNRRRVRDNKIVMQPNPDGSFDGHTPIFRIRRQTAPKQILIVGHACHPTGSGSIEKWSPGYPGAMRDTLEEQFPETRALFVQGCGGDAKIVYRDSKSGKLVFSNDPDHAAEAGRKLADAVGMHLRQQPLQPLAATLACGLASGELSFGQRWSREAIERQAYTGSKKSWLTWAARQYLAMPPERSSFRYDVQVWKLGGRLTVFGMEGEICSPWGPALRALTRTDLAAVIGYANTTAAYIPNAQIVREGGYEGATSHQVYLLPAPFTENIEQELLAIVQKALDQVEATESQD